MRCRQLILTVALIGGLAWTGCSRKPTVVLTYEIVGPPPAHAGDNGAQVVADAINQRLRHRGHASAPDKKQFQVDVYQIRVELYGKLDASDLKLVEQLISAEGGFEFRIMADPEHEADLPTIEQAKAVPPAKHDVMADNNRVAKWVPYAELQFGPVDREVNGVMKRLAAGAPEALVLIDDLNITGEYLTSVEKGAGPDKQPDIHFSLNKAGAEKLKQLTSDNLPEPSRPDAFRKLGIIFNGKLLSAPVLRTTISQSGAISGGGLSEREIDTMIDVLHAGTLPCTIQLVEEKRVDDKK